MAIENNASSVFVFIDAATSPQAFIAIGAFICLEQQQINELNQLTIESLSKHLASRVSYRKYTSNKSTWSEIKTAILALNAIYEKTPFIDNVEIYTDCQSLCDLMGARKEKLQNNNFMTKKGKVFQHANLYKELYAIVENRHVHVFKVKGHYTRYRELTWQERIFSVLDKLSRKKLRSVLKTCH
jgi:ribonuclease HI